MIIIIKKCKTGIVHTQKVHALCIWMRHEHMKEQKDEKQYWWWWLIKDKHRKCEEVSDNKNLKCCNSAGEDEKERSNKQKMRGAEKGVVIEKVSWKRSYCVEE